MIIACPGCGKRYKTDPKRIPARGGFVRCPVCTTRIPVRIAPSPAPAPDRAQAAAEPEKPAAPASQVPVPAQPPPAETPSADTAAAPIHVLADEGLLAARDVDEVRGWICDGRIWPENLVFVPGEEARRADEHPLTRSLFNEPAQAGGEEEEKPEPPAIDAPGEVVSGQAETASPEAAGEAADPWGYPGTGAGTETDAAGSEEENPFADTDLWPTPALETGGADAPLDAASGDSGALVERAPVPAGLRAIGFGNLVLSCVLPPNPVGVAAAIGLLRGRAWGRTLTAAWAGTQLFILLLVWSGFAALFAASALVGGLAEPALALGESRGLVLGALALGALGAYFIVQWSYLAQPRVTEGFTGGGERAALWSGWVVGGLYIAGAAIAAIILLPRLDVAAPLLFRGEPASAAQRVPAAPPAQTPRAERIYTPDGLVSIEIRPPWSVQSVAGGDDAKLGVLLQGNRENPLGKVRVSAARPRDVERMNKRFESLEMDEETIRSVEAVGIGDLEGRRIVLWSKVPGGMTGQILLSLEDGTRGYQFSCAAPGPGFEEIRAECDRMAQSLLITRTSQLEPAAPPAPASESAPPPPGPDAAQSVP